MVQLKCVEEIAPTLFDLSFNSCMVQLKLLLLNLFK